MHSAIRESDQTSAQVASVTVVAQCHIVLDSSAFPNCWPLRAMLQSTPFVGTSLFGKQFQSSVEEAMRSQEQLSQVRQLASAGSKAPQGSLAPRASQQSQNPPPSPRSPSGGYFRGWRFSKKTLLVTKRVARGRVDPTFSLRFSRVPRGRSVDGSACLDFLGLV